LSTYRQHNLQEHEKELNGFIESHKTIQYEKLFIPDGEKSFWSVSLTYTQTGKIPDSKSSPAYKSGKNTVDYKKTLSPEDFTLYLKLKEWRKKIAEEEDLQLFSVFYNEQLANIAEKRVTSLEEMKKIDGIGEGRASKYGKAVLEIVAGEGTKTTAAKTDEQHQG